MSDLPPGPQIGLSTSIAPSPESARNNVYTIKPIELNDIHEDDKTIVLLGRTGVGKSNFIEKLANTELDISSFGYGRGTNDLTLYRIYDHPTWKDRIVLADTPGFQDATISEYGAVKAIRHWIKTSKAPPLHALFYLDRITDPFKGGDKPCWDLFTILCGEGEAERACLVTTAWDLVGHQGGTVSEATAKRTQLAAEKKREQLRTHWEAYLGKGLQFFEFKNTAVSANEILDAALNPIPTDHERFILENMKTRLTKPPVLTPIFRLLVDRHQSIILNISNTEDDLRGESYSEEILAKERVRLEGLRVDLEKLRSEMWDFSEGRQILVKAFFSNVQFLIVSKARLALQFNWFRASRPSPQGPVSKPPVDGQASGNVPDKSRPPIIVTPVTGDRQNPDAPETISPPDASDNEPLPTQSLAGVIEWYIRSREGDTGLDRDIVLVVMGATGVGKTSFIRSCQPLASESHVLDSGTREVSIHTSDFPAAGGRLVLVDTPGFDDPSRSNVDVLQEVAMYLENSYRKGRLIDGLVYLHRITDIRFDAGTAGALNIFRKLYNSDGYSKLALVTTMWNDITPQLRDKYHEKEKELKDSAWGTFLKRDDAALVARYEISDDDATQTTRSAQMVVAGLLLNAMG